MAEETKKSWVVLVNSDLTEGRGRLVVNAVCEIKATAIRLAKKADVQGSDGRVLEVPTFMKEIKGYHGHLTYGPVSITMPTKEDRRYQERIKIRVEAREKALAAGLSLDDIEALR